MRKEFTMTKEQCNKLLEACKPVPYMVIGGVAPRSQQENANAAWASLGLELGFDAMSVRPVAGKGMEVFTAEVVQPVEDQLVETYKGYAITVAPAHQREYRFNFCHPDYDGPEDKRCGFATTVQGCRDQIDELEDSLKVTPKYLGSSKAVKLLLGELAQEFLDGIQADDADAQLVAEPLAKHLAMVLLGNDSDYPGIPNWNEPDGGIVPWVAAQLGAEETDPESVLEHLAIGLFGDAGRVAAYAAEEGVTPEQWQWQYEDVLDRYTRLAMGIPEPSEDE